MLEIGMRVETYIPGHGTGVDTGYIIGIPRYSRGFDDVVVVAEAAGQGMPIAAQWCKPIACGCADGMTFRTIFDKAHPGFLKPLPSHGKEMEPK